MGSGAVPGGVVAGLRYPLIISLINTEFQGFVAGPGLGLVGLVGLVGLPAPAK